MPQLREDMRSDRLRIRVGAWAVLLLRLLERPDCKIRGEAEMTTPKPWLTPSIAPPEPPADPPLPGEDRTMRTMREFGFTGPISRQDYLDFIHASDDPQEPSAELESMLPLHLQDWSQFGR
jgi:hypothetical protein